MSVLKLCRKNDDCLKNSKFPCFHVYRSGFLLFCYSVSVILFPFINRAISLGMESSGWMQQWVKNQMSIFSNSVNIQAQKRSLVAQDIFWTILKKRQIFWKWKIWLMKWQLLWTQMRTLCLKLLECFAIVIKGCIL